MSTEPTAAAHRPDMERTHHLMRKLEALTPAQTARMESFAQEWIEHGLRTRPLTEDEWAVWEAGARRCYEYAQIPWPGVVVRVPNPLIGAFAAPIADITINRLRVGGAVDGAVRTHILNRWYYRFGGRLWPWRQSYIAFFRDVCELQLDGDTWDRSRAYEDAQSAGWWWPFRDFVMVCGVPTVIRLEQVGPTGWGSHRLHCEDGPAVGWPGYELYFWHGTEAT